MVIHAIQSVTISTTATHNIKLWYFQSAVNAHKRLLKNFKRNNFSVDVDSFVVKQIQSLASNYASWNDHILNDIAEPHSTPPSFQVLRIKGIFNLSNQLSNFSKNWGMQHDKTESHKFQRLISPHFCYSRSKIAIIPTILIGNHVVKSFEINLEATN